MRIFINDLEFDLPKKFKIARTKQVNEIGRLNNRQANYTQNIKFPKTKRNIRNMKHLGSIGNTSDIPYILNGVRLYNDAGEAEVFDGIAIPKPTTNVFNFSIYDGFISFAKTVENRVLTDIGLQELNHLKNFDSIKGTWNNSLNYKYIVADYNGRSVVDNKLNIDYLIPSASIKFLWDKIHEFAGYTYEGTVFDEEAFEKLWLTYPKTIGDGTQQTEDVWDFDWDGEVTYLNTNPNDLTILRSSSLLASVATGQVDNAFAIGSSTPVGGIGGLSTLYNEFVELLQTNLYKFRVSGTIFKSGGGGDGSGGTIEFLKGIVGSGVAFDNVAVGDFEYGVPFDFTHYSNVEAGQSIRIQGSILSLRDTVGDVDINWDVVTGNNVDFEEAFLDFDIKDFVNEILWRHSLTPFKDKYTKHIKYLTHREWIQEQEVEDWSSDKGKYVGKTSEGYTFGKYAQRNYLKYKYNDDNQNHSDGYLSVLNKNLKAETTVIASKLFSPEANKNTLIGEFYNVYKFWDKEPKDDGTTDYKELENRFYILRAEEVATAINLTSETSQSDDSNPNYPRENFDRLSFGAIIQDYYEPIYSILNNSKLLKSNVFLNDKDISELDFKKLKFIKEEGGLFLLNKVSNYTKRGATKCEFIRVDRTAEPSVPPIEASIAIGSCTIVTPSEFNFTYIFASNYQFIGYAPVDGVTYLIELLDGVGGNPTGTEYTGNIDENQTTLNHTFQTAPASGWYRISIIDPNENIVSNYCQTFLQDANTPNPEITIALQSSFVNGDPPPVIGQPYLGRINYQFIDFTPTTATMRIQRYIGGTIGNFGGGTPAGVEVVYNDLNLTQDTVHVRNNCSFPEGYGIYRIRIETDTISFQSWYLTF